MLVLVWCLNPTDMQLHAQQNYSARATTEWVVTLISWFNEYYEENLQVLGKHEDKHNVTTWMHSKGNSVIVIGYTNLILVFPWVSICMGQNCLCTRTMSCTSGFREKFISLIDCSIG